MEAIERTRDRGIGAKASLQMIMQNLKFAERVELIPQSRVVVLEVRFGELRRACDENEWEQLKEHLEQADIQTRRAKWWEFHLR